MINIRQFAVAALFAAAGSSFGETVTTITLQVDSFKTLDEAEAFQSDLSKNNTFKVHMGFDGDAPGNYRYCVLVGEFETEEQASDLQATLQDQGVKTRITALRDYDKAEITAAIKGDLPAYFKLLDVPAVPEPATTPTLESPYKEMHHKAKAGAKAAPETLTSWRALLDAMPDDHPMKGGIVLEYANTRFAGHSAYEKNPPDHLEVRKLLTRVANREIAATESQRRTARDKAVLILHYYNNDYLAAVRGYHQAINENAEAKNDPAVAASRTSLAGCITEMAREAGYSRSLAMDAIYDLWSKNVELQDHYTTSSTKEAKAVRNATYRAGIMVTINLIERRQWKDAKVVADSMIGAYTGIEDCHDMLAESLCHKVNICSRLGQTKEAYEAGEKAEAIARTSSLKWGEKNHDPLWKALTWQLSAAVKAKDASKRSDLEAKIRKDFPDRAEAYLALYKNK